MRIKVPFRTSAVMPSDPIARADWLDANGKFEPFTIDVKARDLVARGVVVRDNGTVAWTQEQLAELSKAAYAEMASGDELDAEIALTALDVCKAECDSKLAAEEADREKAYATAKKLLSAGDIDGGLRTIQACPGAHPEHVRLAVQAAYEKAAGVTRGMSADEAVRVVNAWLGGRK